MNHTIKDPPKFTEELRILETTDPAHADTFNALFAQLINNDAFLKALVDLAVEHIGSQAIHVTEEDKAAWDAKAETTEATKDAPGLMSSASKIKLDGMAEGAEPNQNAFSNIKVGTVTITANGETATFFLEAGDNITFEADNATKKIRISSKDTNTTYGEATQSAQGLMSAADKKKLDGVAAFANNYSHPAYAARTSGLYKVTVDAAGHVTSVVAVTKEDIEALGIPGQNTTYGNASASAAGIVSTGAQTFGGNKTFNGQISCAGATAPATAQARNIYAGTADMVAGTTALTSGTIYVMYE